MQVPHIIHTRPQPIQPPLNPLLAVHQTPMHLAVPMVRLLFRQPPQLLRRPLQLAVQRRQRGRQFRVHARLPRPAGAKEAPHRLLRVSTSSRVCGAGGGCGLLPLPLVAVVHVPLNTKGQDSGGQLRHVVVQLFVVVAGAGAGAGLGGALAGVGAGGPVRRGGRVFVALVVFVFASAAGVVGLGLGRGRGAGVVFSLLGRGGLGAGLARLLAGQTADAVGEGGASQVLEDFRGFTRRLSVLGRHFGDARCRCCDGADVAGQGRRQGFVARVPVSQILENVVWRYRRDAWLER